MPAEEVSGIKHEVSAAKIEPVAAVDVLGATGGRRMNDAELPLPKLDRDPPPPPLPGDTVLDADVSLNPKLRNVLKFY